MYIRPVHAELDLPTLAAFVREFPLGLFTTSIPHPNYATLQTTHIPWVLDTPAEGSSDGNIGTLRGHMARANPQTKAMIDQLKSRSAEASSSSSQGYLSSWFSSSTPTASTSDPIELAEEVLVLFNAPTHSYLTPNFYIATKPTTHKVVPTWDYAAVQIYGKARIHHLDNEETSAFLQKQVEDLTREREAAKGEKAGREWKVEEADPSYVAALKRGIIGLEITITRMEGRFKLSQESPDGDWIGVVDGFKALGTPEGDRMAKMIEDRGKHREVKGTGGAGPVA